MIIGFDAKRAFHNSSGLGNYSRDIIRILSTYYPANRYLLYNPKEAKKDRFHLDNNIEMKLPDHFFWKWFSSVWRQGPVSRQIRSDKVEIFHGLSGEIPRGIDRVYTKTVVTIHDLIFMRNPELYKPIDRKIYFNKYKYAAETADIVIAISEQTKKDIIKFLKVDENKVKVHYQGCHPAFKMNFTRDEKENLKEKFSLPNRYILNVGTVEPRKNVLTVIKAIRETRYHLVIVGRPTEYKKQLVAYIMQNNLQDRIHFPENVQMQELAIMYRLADLFCYPSIFEGFGIPIIEALFSEVPVIASIGGCFPEAGGPGSVYLDNKKPEDWTKEIDRLMKDESERKRMVSAGLSYAQRFTDENVGSGLMKLYQELR